MIELPCYVCNQGINYREERITRGCEQPWEDTLYILDDDIFEARKISIDLNNYVQYMRHRHESLGAIIEQERSTFEPQLEELAHRFSHRMQQLAKEYPELHPPAIAYTIGHFDWYKRLSAHLDHLPYLLCINSPSRIHLHARCFTDLPATGITYETQEQHPDTVKRVTGFTLQEPWQAYAKKLIELGTVYDHLNKPLEEKDKKLLENLSLPNVRMTFERHSRTSPESVQR